MAYKTNIRTHFSSLRIHKSNQILTSHILFFLLPCSLLQFQFQFYNGQANESNDTWAHIEEEAQEDDDDDCNF